MYYLYLKCMMNAKKSLKKNNITDDRNMFLVATFII